MGGQFGLTDLRERGRVSVTLAENLTHDGSNKGNSQVSSLGVLSVLKGFLFSRLICLLRTEIASEMAPQGVCSQTIQPKDSRTELRATRVTY